MASLPAINQGSIKRPARVRKSPRGERLQLHELRGVRGGGTRFCPQEKNIVPIHTRVILKYKLLPVILIL